MTDAREREARTAPSAPTRLTRREWVGVLRRTVREFRDDNLTDWAAALTYYAVLALFPALIVFVALVIGTIELLTVAAEKLRLEGGFWMWISGIDLNLVGYGIVGLFVVTWAGAVAVWRFARIEEKWAAGMRSG